MKAQLKVSSLYAGIFFLNVLLQFNTEAQTNKVLLEQFRNYQQSVPQEKVFLHLDKTQYAASETMWIKAYLVAGAMQLPSNISQNLYLELLNKNGEVKQRLTLEAENGLATASLKLDKALATDDYYLRAYTSWMKNFDSDYYFNKKIRIINVEAEGPPVISEPQVSAVALKFYPEGGHLVQNIASKMAFEVMATPGEFNDYSGTIYDYNDKPITTFRTNHENRGMIKFTPKSLNYYAVLDDEDLRFELPMVETQGVVMLVNNKDEEELLVTVKASDLVAQDYFIMAHTRGYVTYASEIKLRGGRGIARIEKSKLPAGISHITLMSNAMEPLAERLAYITGSDNIDLTLKTDNSGYDTRKKVTVDLEVKDAKGKPVEGSFSLSAYHQRFAVNDQTNNHIRANLLLASDLKGHIDNPGQYFNNSTSARRNLDLLLMVKGWSRFSWDQVTAGTFSPKYLPEAGLSIKGKLLRMGKEKIKNGQLYLLDKQSRDLISATTDQEGNFLFTDLNYHDTTQLIFQGMHKKGFKNVELKIDSTFEQMPFSAFASKSLKLSPAREEAFKQQYRAFVNVKGVWERRNGFTDLGEVTVTTLRRGFRNAGIRSMPDAFDFKELPYEEKRRKDPFRAMLGKVPGLNFAATTGPNGNEEWGMQTPRMGFGERWRNTPPTIMIDGLISDAQDVYGLDPHSIDYVITTRVFPGLISIHTMTKETYAKYAPKPGLYVMNLPGYHSPDTFYAPRYDGTDKDADLPDERITLFWEPMITTDTNGRAQITFYTSDQQGPIGIDVQGISFKGQAGNGSSSFTIRSNF